MANQILETLLDYRQQVENTGKVCKSDIIAIEEFLGDAVITEKVNIDKLTEVPSRVGVDEVLETLNEKIDNAKSLDVAPTNVEIVESLNHLARVVLNRFIGIINNILDTESKVSTRIHEAMRDEKIIYRYNEANELIDVTQLPVNEVYAKYKDYFKDVYVNLYGEEKGFELPEITKDDYNPSIAWNLFVSLITVSDIRQAADVLPAMITIKDIAAICENANELGETIIRQAKWISDTLRPDRDGSIDYLVGLHEVASKLQKERNATNDEYGYEDPFELLLNCMLVRNKTNNSDYPTED